MDIDKYVSETRKSYIKGRKDAIADAIQAVHNNFSSRLEWSKEQIIYLLENIDASETHQD